MTSLIKHKNISSENKISQALNQIEIFNNIKIQSALPLDDTSLVNDLRYIIDSFLNGTKKSEINIYEDGQIDFIFRDPIKLSPLALTTIKTKLKKTKNPWIWLTAKNSMIISFDK